MIITRVAFAVLASATFAIDAQPAGAEIYRPWCVQYGSSDRDNGTTCAFTSFEQCMMTARGGGGFCVQNPWYLGYGSGQKSSERATDEATGPSGADRGAGVSRWRRRISELPQ
jgi:hypothetical protein